MKDIKIEKGIPIPILKVGLIATKRLEMFQAMDFGDSFFVQLDIETKRYRSTYHFWLKRGINLDFRIIVRKTDEGYRIWKVKKEEHES
jgi:hypothetical protein